MNIRFTPLTRNHMDEVCELLQNISDFAPDSAQFDNIWLRHSKQSNVFSIVAQQPDGSVLGFGTLLVEIKIRGGKVGHVEDIATHPDFRNLGIGRAVIEKLVSIALVEGCYKVSLHCREHNIDFYEKVGFESSGFSMQKLLFNG